MGYIYIDRNDREQMREQMRTGHGYRTATRHLGNDRSSEAYREGYRHGWEDAEYENEENYRRDSRGRFM